MMERAELIKFLYLISTKLEIKSKHHNFLKFNHEKIKNRIQFDFPKHFQ